MRSSSCHVTLRSKIGSRIVHSNPLHVFLYAFVGLLFGLTCCTSEFVNAQEAGQDETSVDPTELQVTAGFNGTWKLGHVVPLRVQASAEMWRSATRLLAETVDGDGVEVLYRQNLGADVVGSSNELWFPIRVGRRGRPVKVSLVGDEEEILCSSEIDTYSNSNLLDSDQLLFLAIGSSMGVESCVVRNAAKTDSNFSVQVVERAEQLPTSWRDYLACDLLLISSQDLDLLRQMGDRWTAIHEWIRQGGNCIVSLKATSAESLDGSGGFKELLPGQPIATGMVTDPGPLESYVATTRDPLNRISVSILGPYRGQARLSFKDTLGKRVPWWIHYAHGQGAMHLFASDLDQQSFADWSDRREMWSRILSQVFDKSVLEGDLGTEASGDSSYLGYQDLVGQLRATLDFFPNMRTLSFGQICAMLVGVLLVVGPLDYYLSVVVFKRPQFSWYFATISLAAISIGLLLLYQTVRPNEVRLNTAQILDVDLTSQTATGHLWTNAFVGQAHRLDFSVEPDSKNFKDQGNNSLQICVEWQGLPGSGLAGLESQLNAGSGMPSYEIEVDANGARVMHGVAIPSAGTKCLVAEWNQSIDIQGAFRLKELAGIDQLTGEFDNPFACDIKDAYIFYHNWYYRLDSRIPVGGKFVITSEMIPKDLARKLNERKTVAENISSTRWNPAGRNNLDRLLEIMMFHRAATGENYTGLQHRYQPGLDHSNLLETDTAVVVCRLDEPFARVEAKVLDDAEVKVEQDLNRVWCRIAVPIVDSIEFSSQ